MATGGAGLALSNLVSATPDNLSAEQQTGNMVQPALAFRGQHQPKPLAFDPAKLTGISEKLIQNVKWEEVNRCAEAAMKASLA
jgi:Fe-Mn family superoxide dismutase